MSAVLLRPDQAERYRRHLTLPEIGLDGQQKLLGAHILLIGVGGLGCPVAQYLAAAGVGRLGLVDPDRVDASNLQRQVLYGTADLGRLIFPPRVEDLGRTFLLCAYDAPRWKACNHHARS